MRQLMGLAWLAVGLGGCAPTAQERSQTYNDNGIYLYQAGNYAAARDNFQAALALKPDDAGLLFNVGQSYDRLGDAARAEPCYRQCLQHAPNHAPCHHALAVLLVHQGRRPEAIQLVADWMRREPQRATPYAEDGWLWRQYGDLPRAQARLQQALAIDPRDTRALTELAIVYETMQRPDRAIVLYERALEADPNQPDVKRRLGILTSRGVSRPQPE